MCAGHLGLPFSTYHSRERRTFFVHGSMCEFHGNYNADISALQAFFLREAQTCKKKEEKTQKSG